MPKWTQMKDTITLGCTKQKLLSSSIFNFSWPLTVTTVFVKILSVPGLLSLCSRESCMWTKKVPFQEP